MLDPSILEGLALGWEALLVLLLELEVHSADLR